MSSAEATHAGTGLLAVLRERIRQQGPLRLDAYMATCLTDPVHGYWNKPRSIGADGDFITAPEISQVFGELLGLWAATTWQGMGHPARVRLIELGPGRGTLMRDALRAAAIVAPFRAALSVHLIEKSPALRHQQQAMLASAGAATLSWHEDLAEVPAGPAIVIANEFLDALPIRQLVFGNGVWRERTVELDSQGVLRFGLGEVVPFAGHTRARPGDVAELRGGEDVVLAELKTRSAPVSALLIDYGPAAPAYGDTLQAVRRHAYVPPLSDPGDVDLTAHVRFATLLDKARAAGLAAHGPLTQAEFLGRLGIIERAARLMAANPGEAGQIEAAVQRLLMPTGMGGQIKVLAVGSPRLPSPAPFA
ncbi:MAG TPA: SAM-dependent methyltransferase [Hyphomicrobiaceae bacterium]|jgi:SAM-dependent MidA family methyltransferase|nr:SAM-dependent methyltransferase [Hyphomicrobiaceae bacterium]